LLTVHSISHTSPKQRMLSMQLIRSVYGTIGKVPVLTMYGSPTYLVSEKIGNHSNSSCRCLPYRPIHDERTLTGGVFHRQTVLQKINVVLYVKQKSFTSIEGFSSISRSSLIPRLYKESRNYSITFDVRTNMHFRKLVLYTDGKSLRRSTLSKQDSAKIFIDPQGTHKPSIARARKLRHALGVS